MTHILKKTGKFCFVVTTTLTLSIFIEVFSLEHSYIQLQENEADLDKAIRHMRKHGMLATGAKAKATGLGGTSGGVLVGLQTHLTFWFSPLLVPPGSQNQWLGMARRHYKG